MLINLKHNRSIQLTIACLFFSLIAMVLISLIGLIAGIIIISLVAILLLISLTFNDYRHGFLLLVLFAFFMFNIYRIAPSTSNFPVGIAVELLLALLFAAVLIKKRNKESVSTDLFNNPITYALIAFCIYSFVMLFNPASKSVLGRVQGFREIATYLILFIVTVYVFNTHRFIYFFSHFWIFLATLAALYGIYQEIFGLQDWELRWLYAQPDHGQLAIVWGHIRKWSFLSDINAFGLLMAYGGIICLILALGPFSMSARWLYGICAGLMLIAMTFSGTRTAMAMVVAGLAFYVSMTLNRSKSFFLAAFFVIGTLALFFGPFYGPNFNRLRSTFDLSGDASMNVRNETRERMKPYAQSHPFGGGINTTGALGLKYDPGHPLAGHWDTDSGYLKTALERGWIGLILQLTLYATIVIYGLNFFYQTTNHVAATYGSAYICGFFALTIANYAQDSLEQKPINLIVMSSIASIITFSFLDKNKNNAHV